MSTTSTDSAEPITAVDEPASFVGDLPPAKPGLVDDPHENEAEWRPLPIRDSDAD